MTEHEWLNANDFSTLHSALWQLAPEQPRKYRLVGSHFCRLICHHIKDERFLALIDLAERYAEGEQLKEQLIATLHSLEESGVLGRGTGSELHVAQEACLPYFEFEEYDSNQIDRLAADAHDMLHERAGANDPDESGWDSIADAVTKQTNEILVPLIRDIFGNPFHPVTVDPRWLTETVVTLASGIYADRAFDRMPILADALEDAECDDADILSHCRGDGPHVRGCWVVDLMLGKQ